MGQAYSEQAEGYSAAASASRHPHPTVCALAERLDPVHVQCLEKCEHGHIETVERILSPAYVSHGWAIPCPQCVGGHQSPPYCFSRQECASRLQVASQSGSSLSSLHVECLYCARASANRDPLVRVLDVLAYDIYVSYELGVKDAEDGKYPILDLVNELQTLLERKADVLCWVR